MKAYRGHVREGTLAPVLLSWVPHIEGRMLQDGHDRAVAAPAEGLTPPCVVLERSCGERPASSPYYHSHPHTWPLPGGAVTWDDLAARVMFQCGSD